MNKEKASLVSEQTLWQIYRRLLAAQTLSRRLDRAAPGSAAVAAALAEGLIEGDLIGIPEADAQARYVCGLPLDQVRQCTSGQASRRPSTASASGGSHAPAELGGLLLPGNVAEQAGYAIGAAVAMRLRGKGNLVILSHQEMKASRAASLRGLWAAATQKAVLLQLPLLFVSESRKGLFADATDPRVATAELPTIPVDRNDAIALHRVLYESIARARLGGGPTWIDCREVPIRGAVADPLAKLEESMRARQIFWREEHRHLERAIAREFARIGWKELSE